MLPGLSASRGRPMRIELGDEVVDDVTGELFGVVVELRASFAAPFWLSGRDNLGRVVVIAVANPDELGTCRYVEGDRALGYVVADETKRRRKLVIARQTRRADRSPKSRQRSSR